MMHRCSGERVHPQVVEAMRELGIDLSRRTPQALNHELAMEADVLDQVRAIRDDISRRVDELLWTLDSQR